MIAMGRRKENDDMIEIPSTKKYASVLLTRKEFLKGRKRWMEKHSAQKNIRVPFKDDI
jgi:hypothetical protein